MLRFKAYSILEIILVTTFVIIFIIVTNPATYINRFSKMLLKMNVLNESALLVNKINSYAYGSCTKSALSSSSFSFTTNDGYYALFFDSDSFYVKNLLTNTEAVLYRYVNNSSLNTFKYYNYYFNETSLIDDAVFIDLSIHSSLLTHELIGSVFCESQKIILGEY